MQDEMKKKDIFLNGSDSETYKYILEQRYEKFGRCFTFSPSSEIVQQDGGIEDMTFHL